ncbi:nicotinamide riboside kinase 1-like isoform X1 [Ptychodera flava]|uniref:nicotinamide riboside kinase 1-like isoform X1 n=1 Tax=Ptychodera flava TaxID=63121 RepID=UPI003969CF6E
METRRRTVVVGISGVSNGGKTTLASRLEKDIPNSYNISQDTYFVEEEDVLIDEKTGYERWDDLTAMNMDEMMKDVNDWITNPQKFCPEIPSDQSKHPVHVLIIEGILIFNYRPLLPLFDLKYFLTLPFEEAKRRRSQRVYIPPDPPGMFDEYVWRMYLENKKELENEMKVDMVYLDGTKNPDENYNKIKEDLLTLINSAEKS